MVATPMVFDHDYLLALLTAAGEIGASGAHMAVFPRINSDGQYESALSAWHWNTYAEADLLITSNLGNDIGLPGASTAYGNKVGSHPYRTDFEAINRPGHKTRWLALGYDVARQQRYFPTAERRDRTLRGAQAAGRDPRRTPCGQRRRLGLALLDGGPSRSRAVRHRRHGRPLGQLRLRLRGVRPA